MSISIRQTCDGCGTARQIEFTRSTDPEDLDKLAERNGWRAVLNGKHLCTDCLKAAVNT